jgi:hypothetical protein
MPFTENMLTLTLTEREVNANHASATAFSRAALDNVYVQPDRDPRAMQNIYLSPNKNKAQFSQSEEYQDLNDTYGDGFSDFEMEAVHRPVTGEIYQELVYFSPSFSLLPSEQQTQLGVKNETKSKLKLFKKIICFIIFICCIALVLLFAGFIYFKVLMLKPENGYNGNSYFTNNDFFMIIIGKKRQNLLFPILSLNTGLNPHFFNLSGLLIGC